MSEPSKHCDAADENDRANMLGLCAGHHAALNDLMERHAARLFNYLVRSLQNEDDAADIAQETFARVYLSRQKFDPSQRFSVWLYAIASNLVRTQFRHRARHPTVPLDALPDDAPALPRSHALTHDSPDPRQSIESAETADAVRKAIAALPEELRTPLILSEYEDLSHSEIGAILNCSAKAVETRLYRARKHLRATLSRLIS
jgi:RNA polymerase sigma factor (sigma-70 family)